MIDTHIQPPVKRKVASLIEDEYQAVLRELMDKSDQSHLKVIILLPLLLRVMFKIHISKAVIWVGRGGGGLIDFSQSTNFLDHFFGAEFEYVLLFSLRCLGPMRFREASQFETKN